MSGSDFALSEEVSLLDFKLAGLEPANLGPDGFELYSFDA